MGLLTLLLIIGAVVGIVMLARRPSAVTVKQSQDSLEDARFEARRWVERLGGEVLNLTGSDTASQQAIADASERYNAASSELSMANSPAQAKSAKQSALEGLHYIKAAREIMGMPPGPYVPELEGQQAAGRVTEDRTIEFEGQQISASPNPSAENSHYYPGGRVAGRPVPAGWYSTAWWAPAMASGMWTMASVMMFSSMFHGMAGVNYSAQDFESGAADGTDLGGDLGDTGGDMGDAGGDGGGFFDGGDSGDGGSFFDFGGGDGGGFDFGGFDF